VQERYNSHLKNITIFNKIFLIQGLATGHIFCTRQLLEKKWEYSEAVHQVFVYFKKTSDSGRREAFCNILSH
jgi:hypothetical protein